MREFAQAGVELIGAPAPQGTVEVVEVLEAALDAAGLDRAVIGLGDADLYRQLLAELQVEGEARDAILTRLEMHDLVGVEEELKRAGIGDEQVATCVALSQLRGGREVLERAREIGGDAVERAIARLGETFEALEGAASPVACSSTSACCATSATTAARSSRSTTRRSATCSAAAGATTGC